MTRGNFTPAEVVELGLNGSSADSPKVSCGKPTKMIQINQVYEMDALVLLKQLDKEVVDLIYSDILFATGKNQGDYEDIKPIKNEVFNFYIPIIKEMYRVLKNTGSIYIHCDYRIVHWIRCILDDIFGYDTFRNEIIWCYTSGNPAFKTFSRKHDNILFYSKSDIYTFNIDSVRQKHRSTEKLKYKLNRNGRYSLRKNELGRSPLDWWDIPLLTNTSKERSGYTSQKPKELLRRIILASSNQKDLILDCFGGSGTTFVVAQENSRNFIGCDKNKKAVEISNQRLKQKTVSGFNFSAENLRYAQGFVKP